MQDVTAPGTLPSFQYEWEGQRPPAGRSWRYAEEAMLGFHAESRLFYSAGRPRLKRYLSDAVDAQLTDQREGHLWSVESIVRTAMRELALAIARDPRVLREIEWRDLERVLREVFERLGFTTQLTRSAMDGGFDLRLVSEEEGRARTFLVEVKHWLGSNTRLGQSVLRAFFDVVARDVSNATGLLLSSTGFTSSVMSGRTEVEQLRLRLGGRNKILSLCQHYLLSVEGIWTPTTGLADMLLAGTH